MKTYAYIIGAGLFMTAIHHPDQPLLKYLFIPQVGLMMVILASFVCLFRYRDQITFGSKWVYIPLLVIALSIGISGVVNQSISFAIGSILLGAMMFVLYLVARILGRDMFAPFMYGVIIGAIGVLIYAAVYPEVKTGGIISPTNYDITTGALIFGAVVTQVKRQWWLWCVAVVGLAFTGSEEAIFVMVVLIIAMVVRRDFGKRLLLPVGIGIIFIMFALPTGVFQGLYQSTTEKVMYLDKAIKVRQEGDIDYSDRILNYVSGDRWLVHWRISDIKPVGYGYNMTNFYYGIPHNMVLIIIEQVGIAAAIAWLFIMLYCLVKTKWRYAIVAVLALGVFDHFLWTQIGMWWWALVGVATASNIPNDYVFKGGNI